MDTPELLRRLAHAVTRGLEARSAFYASIDLEDHQNLGPPASPASIQHLEARIGRPLPPSYKAFLSLHNGWRMVDAVTDLLSVDEMLSGERAAKIQEWQQQAGKWGDKVAAHGLVIGHSQLSQSRILLDPSSTRHDGEWRVLERYKDEEVPYGSFLDWLEQSVLDYEGINRPESYTNDED